MSLISEIKQRVPIESVAKEYIHELKEQRPGRFAAKCPFHEDSNASLIIETMKGTFYCFGCQARGDVVDLYRHINNLTQKEAISALAKKAGIDSGPAPQLTQEERKQLAVKRAYKTAQTVYQRNLWANAPVVSYMQTRGIDEETLKRFGIGFSPTNSSSLKQELAKNGIDQRLSIECGVLAVSKQGKVYDPMFGRITFPIFSSSGDCTGYSGRIMPDNTESSAKYKNTAGNEYFRKKECLFGIPEALEEIKKQNRVIVVEGNIDVLAMRKAGFKICVGTMGTSITPEQIAILSQHASWITFLLDGDAAGRKATLKVLDIALRAGMKVNVALLTDGHDPASLLCQSDGADKIAQILKDSVNGLDMWLAHLEEESLAALAAWIRSFLSSFQDDLVRLLWARLIAVCLGVTPSQLLQACEQPNAASLPPSSASQPIPTL